MPGFCLVQFLLMSSVLQKANNSLINIFRSDDQESASKHQAEGCTTKQYQHT